VFEIGLQFYYFFSNLSRVFRKFLKIFRFF